MSEGCFATGADVKGPASDIELSSSPVSAFMRQLGGVFEAVGRAVAGETWALVAKEAFGVA